MMKAFLGVAPSSARIKPVAPLTGQAVNELERETLGFRSFFCLFFYLYLVSVTLNQCKMFLIPCASSLFLFLSLPRITESLQTAASVSLSHPQPAHWELTCAVAGGVSQATCSCPRCHGDRGRGHVHLIMK